MASAVAKKKAPGKKAASSGGKSGIRTLKPGEVLFDDGARADSLFIIQKGQLRLYKPKGKGFIEIAVLRAGEVIGEMAFFDEDGSGGVRSCAAQAIVSTEIIEISFAAFGKTMSKLNPWFKTIINTLASRLRKANSRIRELESNSLGYGDKANTYQFMKESDAIRSLSTIYLVFNAHATKGDNGHSIHKRTMGLYSSDVYGIMEAKFEAVLSMLEKMEQLTIEVDENNLPNMYVLKDVDYVRSVLVFMNTEKQLTDDKKTNVNHKAMTFLEDILKVVETGEVTTDPKSKFERVQIAPILKSYKDKNLNIDVDDLDDCKRVGLTNDALINTADDVQLEINAAKLTKMVPLLRFLAVFKEVNARNQK